MENTVDNKTESMSMKPNKQPCLLDYIDISVSEAEKRANGALNIREYFTVYLIETVVKDPNYKKLSTKLGTIWRRYTEFEQLHSYLEVTYPYLILPPLPEKKILFGWHKSGADTFDPDFVDRRRTGLENFLLRVASYPLLCFDEIFIGFLQQEDGWKETCKETGYLQMAENKLKTLAALPGRIKRPDERFEAVKDYSNELSTHLSSLLKIRSKLAERFYTVYKLHANYGRVFSEWSAVEKTMGDGLQKAGHFLDSIAASIDLCLEEEELIADKIKEYLFFASSLQAVCKRRDMLQLQLQKAQELINNRQCEKEQIEKGKRGLMSRIFGTVDNEEIRESKMNAAEQRIQESKCNLQAVQDELNDFTREALADFERFENQKMKDIKQTLANYVGVQIKIAKQGLQTWAHVKNCLEKNASLEHGLEKSDELPCRAPISRLRVEKIEGGLVVAGVVVAANCQVALPVFGCLFILVGIVLTVASYRGPGKDEAPENYAARLAFTGNSRILGPACIAVGFIMLSAGIALCLLTKRARKKEKRVGFHCPIHGDFYPLSPVTASKALGKYETGWGLCFGRARNLGMDRMPRTPPQCPHTHMSSSRSSFSSVPISPCPTPVPFLFASNSISSDLANSMGANVSPDQTFGSIRSLSVSREVASFPLSRTPSPPSPRNRSCTRPQSTKKRNYKISETEDSNLEVIETIENSYDDNHKSNNSTNDYKNKISNSSSTDSSSRNNNYNKADNQELDDSSLKFPQVEAAQTEIFLLESSEAREQGNLPDIWAPDFLKDARKSASVMIAAEENG